MPDSVRNSHVRFDNSKIPPAAPVEKTMIHANTRTTPVRTAVARLESTPVTPILARMAVTPAKRAESKDQVSQFMPTDLWLRSAVEQSSQSCSPDRVGQASLPASSGKPPPAPQYCLSLRPFRRHTQLSKSGRQRRLPHSIHK